MTKSKELHKKIIDIQGSIAKLFKEKDNPFFKSKYVPLSEILAQIKPVLHKEGLYLTQQLHTTAEVTPPVTVLKTKILDKSGEVVLESSAPLPVKDINNPQAWGSSITYMRRYSLTSILGIEESDDDGSRATRETISYRLANAMTEDEEEMKRVWNEKQYNELKNKLLSANSLDEIEDIKDSDKSTFNKLKKYGRDLFDNLVDIAQEKKKEIQNEPLTDEEKEEIAKGVEDEK